MKRIKTLLLILLYIKTPLLNAHAVVTHSTLKINPVVAERPTQIELMFNSKIELNLSQIFLVSSGDIKQAIAPQASQKPGQLLINLPPLKSGEYALQLKIFAADGHLSEDLIRFFVND